MNTEVKGHLHLKVLNSSGKRCREAARWQEEQCERAGLNLVQQSRGKDTFATYRQPSEEMARGKEGLCRLTESTGI